MRLVGTLELEHAVTAPAVLPLPWVPAARPVSVRVRELGSLRDVQREQLVGVFDDDNGLPEPGLAETELAADDLVARFPAVRSVPQCPIPTFPSSSRS